MLVLKCRPVHGQSGHLVNATILLLHQKIIVQHFLDHLASLLQQIVFRHFRSLDGLFQLLRKNGFFSMQSLNLEFFLNVKIFSYLVKMKIQTGVYIVYLNDLENLERDISSPGDV